MQQSQDTPFPCCTRSCQVTAFEFKDEISKVTIQIKAFTAGFCGTARRFLMSLNLILKICLSALIGHHESGVGLITVSTLGVNGIKTTEAFDRVK